MFFKLLNSQFAPNKLYYATVPSNKITLMGVFGSTDPLSIDMNEFFPIYDHTLSLDHTDDIRSMYYDLKLLI